MNECPLMDHNETKRWYSIFCKPRQEGVAEENLQRQGFHVYLPRMQLKQRRRGRWISVVEALFPRYLFIRIDPLCHNVAPIRSTRGVVGLVRYGRDPAILPDTVIQTILQRADCDSGLHQNDHPLFSVGDPVKVMDGPLAGMEGVFAEEDGDKRVIVLLELLGKTNKIRINCDSLARAA